MCLVPNELWKTKYSDTINLSFVPSQINREPKIPWMDPDCYNGARYDDYAWAQSLKDVDIRIKVSFI